MVLKSEIEEKVYFSYRKAQIEALHTDRLDCIHVSDLLKECTRYVAYEKHTPPSLHSMTTEDAKSLIFGQILHKTIILNKERNEVPLLWNYENGNTWNADTWGNIQIKDDERWNYIAGSIDDIIQLKGESIICDKKTTGSIGWFSKASTSANEGHQMQTNMYRVMLKKCYGIDAKWGCNVYISNCINGEDQKYEKPAIKVYKLGKIDEIEELMLERAKTIKHYMTSKEMPPQKKNFLCDGFCPHATKCFTEERKKFE